MSGHTSGPWSFKPADEWEMASGKRAQWGRYDIEAGSKWVSGYYLIGSVSNVNNSPQNEANARLIAAAPCLLEALQQLLYEVSLAGLDDAKDFGWPHVVKQAHAAIAKATGSTE